MMEVLRNWEMTIFKISCPVLSDLVLCLSMSARTSIEEERI